jgi:hypothetical protein
MMVDDTTFPESYQGSLVDVVEMIVDDNSSATSPPMRTSPGRPSPRSSRW